MECDPHSFEWANDVEQLAQHFACERGFATVTGPDIPNYVVEPTNEYYQRCLVSEGGWACDAKHHATRRLCPCMPAGGSRTGRAGRGGGAGLLSKAKQGLRKKSVR